MRRQFASEAVEARMERRYGPEIDLGCFDRCRAIADGTLDLPLGEFLDLLDAEIERSDAP